MPVKEKGFILLSSYLVIVSLMAVAFALFSRNILFLQATERNQNKTIAFNMAEAGLDLAIVQLREDSGYEGTNGFSALNSSGGYQVQVCPPECDGMTEPASPNVRLIQSIGYAPDNNSASKAYASRTVLSYIQLGGEEGLFNYAIFAEDGIQMSGNVTTDSYNSNNGAYGGSNVGSKGDIGTDSTGAHTIMLSGNVIVNGNAVVGPGGSSNVIVKSGWSRVTGTVSAASEKMDYETTTTNVASSGSLSVTGNSIEYLPAGTYHYDSLQVSGNGKLVPLGPVQIYVDGTVQISGNGVATYENKPPNFLIYSTNGANVSVSGNAAFYGGIYAPESYVTVNGNGSIYGAVVSEDYHQSGNAKIHFDEAMKDTGSSGEGSEVSVLSWQEKGILNTE